MHIHVDNQWTMFVAKNLVINKISDHIDLKYHTIRDCDKKSINKLNYIGIEHAIADSMIKAVYKVKHRLFTGMLLQNTETINDEKWLCYCGICESAR